MRALPHRRLFVAILLAVMLPVWHGAAWAGWRYAEWQMTRDQVIAASGGEAKAYLVANRRAWG